MNEGSVGRRERRFEFEEEGGRPHAQAEDRADKRLDGRTEVVVAEQLRDGVLAAQPALLGDAVLRVPSRARLLQVGGEMFPNVRPFHSGRIITERISRSVCCHTKRKKA